MRLVKKVTAAAMASAMALSLAACGGGNTATTAALLKNSSAMAKLRNCSSKRSSYRGSWRSSRDCSKCSWNSRCC